MNHKIGYACISQSTDYRTSRRFALKDFSQERFLETTKANIDDLYELLKWNVAHDILMFRISSDIIPFASHEINEIPWWDVFAEQLETIGDYIRQNDIRVSMHPGQYTVLNSPDPDVVERSVKDLCYHTRFLDAMKLNSNHKLIIHVGGIYNDKASAKKRFIKEYEALNPAIKARLILENDDTSYTVEDVLELCTNLKMPMVIDNLHHELNPCTMPWSDILRHVAQTWTQPHETMKFHYSDQDPWERKNGHSQSIHTDAFLKYMASITSYEVDIMLEVKDKDISTLKANLLLKDTIEPKDLNKVWQHYQYRILEVGPSYQSSLKEMIDNNESIENLFMYLDAVLLLPYDKENFRNAAKTVYEIIKPFLSNRELNHFQKLMDHQDTKAQLIKSNLKRLAEKYHVRELTQSYYFQYTARLDK